MRNFLADALVVLMLIAVIGATDVQQALAVIFTHDKFYHFDSLLMAPAWAHLNGLTLNSDVISQYSMVIPVVVGRLADAFGGFGYQSVLTVLVLLVTLYFIAFYWVLRSWLGSAVWAVFGILLALKLHMFHDGVTPVVWRFPSTTVVRYWFDLFALYAVWRHCATFQTKYLWAAFAVAGIALAYMTDTGLYLLFALYVYLAAYLIKGHRQGTGIQLSKQWPSFLVLCGMPFAIALGVLFSVQGPAVLTQQMWINAFEFAGYFLQGWGAIPMHEVLQDRQFFAFFMGFFIPAVYVWTLIYVGGKCLTGRAPWRDMFAVFLCVYGLFLYQYFVNRSALNSYYVVCLPYVGVVCYWLDALTRRSSVGLKRNIKLAAIGIVVALLGANRWFALYPNVLSIKRDAWAQEEEAFKREFDFSSDARLIQGLTAPDERVALISNFETALLMGAQRKPFFYLFPLIESARCASHADGRNYLYTQERLIKTLRQIEDQKPRYIFIEKKFWQAYEKGSHKMSGTLRELLRQISGQYSHQEDGQYLAAFKRRI